MRAVASEDCGRDTKGHFSISRFYPEQGLGRQKEDSLRCCGGWELLEDRAVSSRLCIPRAQPGDL